MRVLVLHYMLHIYIWHGSSLCDFTPRSVQGRCIMVVCLSAARSGAVVTCPRIALPPRVKVRAHDAYGHVSAYDPRDWPRVIEKRVYTLVLVYICVIAKRVYVLVLVYICVLAKRVYILVLVYICVAGSNFKQDQISLCAL